MALKIITDTDTSLQLRLTNPALRLLAIAALIGTAAAFGLLAERATLTCDRDAGGTCTVARYSIRGVDTASFNLHTLTGTELAAYTGGRGAKYRIEFSTAGETIPFTTHTNTFKYFEQQKLDQLRARLADRTQPRIQVAHGPATQVWAICGVLGVLGLVLLFMDTSSSIVLNRGDNTLTLETRSGLRTRQQRTLALDQVTEIRSVELPSAPLAQNPAAAELIARMKDGREISLIDDAVSVGARERLAIKQRISTFLARRPATALPSASSPSA